MGGASDSAPHNSDQPPAGTVLFERAVALASWRHRNRSAARGHSEAGEGVPGAQLREESEVAATGE